MKAAKQAVRSSLHKRIVRNEMFLTTIFSVLIHLGNIADDIHAFIHAQLAAVQTDIGVLGFTPVPA